MLIGITGQIGAGKTTLAQMFEAMGAVVLNADKVGHDVIEVPAVRAKLVEHFGSDILTEAGRLNRRELGRRAFVDADAKADLENIVQAPLQKELWERVRAAQESIGEDGVVIVDAALILEWGQAEAFDKLIVVKASDAKSISRLGSARGLSEGEVRQRMASQTSADEKVGRADIVVDNDGDLSYLQTAAERIWRSLAAQDKAVGNDS